MAVITSCTLAQHCFGDFLQIIFTVYQSMSIYFGLNWQTFRLIYAEHTLDFTFPNGRTKYHFFSNNWTTARAPTVCYSRFLCSFRFDNIFIIIHEYLTCQIRDWRRSKRFPTMPRHVHKQFRWKVLENRRSVFFRSRNFLFHYFFGKLNNKFSIC